MEIKTICDAVTSYISVEKKNSSNTDSEISRTSDESHDDESHDANNKRIIP